MRKRMVWLLVMAMAVVGCQSQPVPVSSIPTFADTLAATPGPDVQPAIDKDFNDPSEGWCQSVSFDFGDFYCQGGELHLVAKGTGNVAASDGGIRSFKNFILQAQMRLIGGKGAYGVVFRGNGDSSRGQRSFYIFMLHPDGKYQLSSWSQSGPIGILIPWTASPAIKPGEAPNLLQVIAQDTRLTLFVNNQQLVSVTDASFDQGTAGPVALEEGHAAASTFKIWELFAVASVR
jgi:hypothetical protein